MTDERDFEGECPACGSDKTHFRDSYQEGGYEIYPKSCHKCGATWDEVTRPEVRHLANLKVPVPVEADPETTAAEVMTPEEFKAAMEQIADSGDPEIAHSRADDLMGSLLTALGYVDGVKVFAEMGKWYS